MQLGPIVAGVATACGRGAAAAAGLFDADHVGAHVREDHRAVRAGRQAGEVENANVVEG
jgi:hypothetical protein